MLERIQKLVSEYTSIEGALVDPEITADRARFRDLSIRHATLAENIELFKEYIANEQAITEAREILKSGDKELAELATEQLSTAEAARPIIEGKLKIALLPRDVNSGKNVIIELRAGTGGEEAALFAAELARAYMRFAEIMHFKVELLEKSDADAGGVKEIVFLVQGKDAYAKFKFEGGTHRVQRVPETEAKGRIHTSAITVAVLPEAEEVDIEIRQQDLRIDTYCAGGAGGQHVNKTESAVRITHLPTGLAAACQNERSQTQNRAQAMAMLRSRLLAHEQEKSAKERGDLRAGMVGSGDRSEKIRTYNFPQDRITDHRIGASFSNLPGIMEGKFADIVDALTEADIAEKMKNG